MDSHHLNKYGASEFSKLFSDIILGRVDPNKVFYNSYAEKMSE